MDQIRQGQREDGQDDHHAVRHHLFGFHKTHAEENQQEKKDPNVMSERQDVEREKAEDRAERDGSDQRGFAAGFDETHHAADDHQHDINPEHSLRIHRCRIVELSARSK